MAKYKTEMKYAAAVAAGQAPKLAYYDANSPGVTPEDADYGVSYQAQDYLA